MKRTAYRWGQLLSIVALIGLITPPAAVAGEKPVFAPKVLDARLDPDNVLRGTAVTSAGTPHANALVTLAHQNQAVATAETNAEGQFGFRLKQGGVYQLAVGERIIMCRVWPPQQAPPAAKPELLLVADQRLARGQRPLGEAIFSTPVLVGVVIAAAVAIPLAINAADDNPSGS